MGERPFVFPKLLQVVFSKCRGRTDEGYALGDFLLLRVGLKVPPSKVKRKMRRKIFFVVLKGGMAI